MGGITMWIILGILILIVIVFLTITKILDNKKSKKLKLEKEQLLKKTKNALPKIVIQVVSIINSNNKKLKKFIPSVGKTKMYDINQDAKKALVAIKNSPDFKLIKTNEIFSKNFETNTTNLINSKSNNWEKRNQKEMHFFLNFEKIQEEMINKQNKKIEKEMQKVNLKKKSKIFAKFKKKKVNNE